MYSDHPAYPYKADWFIWDEIKNRTNVTLDLSIAPMSDYTNKRSLLISTGDQPQVIPKTYPGQEVAFIPSGQILAISDYFDKMPNFSKSVKDWGIQSDVETLRQKDGKIYLLPELHEVYVQDYSFCVRVDILKKNNIPIPADNCTWDDIEKMLRALKKVYPDLYPWSDRWQMGLTYQVAGPAFGMAQTGIKGRDADWNFGCSFFMDKSGKAVFYGTSPEYKKMTQFFAKLIKDGLLDPESCTQTDEQTDAKFVNGKSFFSACNSQVIATNFVQKMDAVLGKGNYELKKISVPAGPGGNWLYGTRLENGIMFSSKIAKDKNFDDILKFVDWLYYSYDGQELMKFGVKGKHFTVRDGEYTLMPGNQLAAFLGKTNDTDFDIRLQGGCGNGVFILVNGGPAPLAYAYMKPADRAYPQMSAKNHKMMPLLPNILYTQDELDAQNMIKGPLLDYVFASTYKFLLGQSNFDKDWDDYVKQCEVKGSKTYIDKMNATLTAAKKK